MGVCANCGRSLERAWKYCIYCGVTLEPGSAVPGDPGASAVHADPAALGARTAPVGPIPGAIRPSVQPPEQRSKLDVPLLIGIVVAAAGAGMIIYLAILFLVPRG